MATGLPVVELTDTTIVYIDGSQRQVNGRPRAGYGIFWCDADFSDLTTSDIVDGSTTTNNDNSCSTGNNSATCARAEVMAMRVVLQQVAENVAANVLVIIKCDNIYVVRGVNEWMAGWHTKGYVGRAHADLWRLIHHYYSLVSSHVRVQHVYAHRGEFGNEMADQLAKGEITPEEAAKQALPVTSVASVSHQLSSVTLNSTVDSKSQPTVTAPSRAAIASRPSASNPVRAAGMAPTTLPSRQSATTATVVTSTINRPAISNLASRGSASSQTSYQPQTSQSNQQSQPSQLVRPSQTAQLAKAITTTVATSTIDKFKQWLSQTEAVDATAAEVQHGQQLKTANQKGGIIFYHTGTVLPQGLWWKEKWEAYKSQS